jgi:hypothetical protein
LIPNHSSPKQATCSSTKFAPHRVAIRCAACVWLHDSFSVRESSIRSEHPPLFAPSRFLTSTSLAPASLATASKTGQDRSQTQGLSNSKRNAHPFLNNLALLPVCPPALPSLHALHREIARPRLERQRGPVGRSVGQSVSQSRSHSRSPSPHFLAPSLSNLLPLMLLLCFASLPA